MGYNFEKHDWLFNDLLGLPYDFKSVMHYDQYAFSINGEKTIVAIEDANTDLGQRDGMSELDFKKLNKLYSCGEFRQRFFCVFKLLMTKQPVCKKTISINRRLNQKAVWSIIIINDI